MRSIRILAAIFVTLTLIFGFNQFLFSWGLFNLFSDTTFTKDGLDKVEQFNPEKDILYLPQFEENKELFHSVRDFSVCRKTSVRKYIYVYLTRGREYVKNAIARSYQYRDLIDEVFEKNPDIPKEIAILPLLESGFNPRAVSRSNAVGLWQFVGNTSTPLGLKVNRWVDERRNIMKSTEAALRHLRNLHRRFKSWDLALAAYNGGGGHVGRAMLKSGATNIWELRDKGALRKETHEYVPRFIALVLIYKNQRLFGIKEEIEQPKIKETTTVTLNHTVKINDVAKIAGISSRNIKELNPQFKQNIVPVYNSKYRLILPAEAGSRLNKNKHKLRKVRITRIHRHRVRRGECISNIARRFKKKLQQFSGLTT